MTYIGSALQGLPEIITELSFSSRSRLGSWRQPCQAFAGCCRLRALVAPAHPFTPPSPGSATPGGAVFLTTKEAGQARPEITGPPRFGEPSHLHLPEPSHCPEALSGFKGGKVSQASSRAPGRPELISHLPRPIPFELPASGLGDAPQPSQSQARRVRALRSGGPATSRRPGHPRAGGGGEGRVGSTEYSAWTLVARPETGRGGRRGSGTGGGVTGADWCVSGGGAQGRARGGAVARRWRCGLWARSS